MQANLKKKFWTWHPKQKNVQICCTKLIQIVQNKQVCEN